jgi:hypothetical protein
MARQVDLGKVAIKQEPTVVGDDLYGAPSGSHKVLDCARELFDLGDEILGEVSLKAVSKLVDLPNL